MSVQHDSHGNSVAAWAAVLVIMVGALLMTLAVVWGSTLWFVLGGVVCVVGAVVGKVLAMAGYGVDGKKGATA